MPAAVQTSVLDVLKSAQESSTGNLNVNATISSAVVTGSVDVTNGAGGSAVNIQDGGNSITVDGSVAIGSALPAGSNAIGKLAANDGVDIGDVTINNASIAITAAALPLPSGAATAAKQPALGTAGTPSSDVITVQGVTSMTALKVDGSGVTQPVSGTVTINALTNASIVKAQLQDNSGNALNSTSNALNVSVQNSSLAATQSGTWTVQPGNTANTTAWLVKATCSTATLSNVASSATTVSILASNSNRLGMTLYNDSTQTLYLKFGTTASSSSYTLQIPAGAYYEMPRPVYTGAIDGIWASANGNARVTELT